MSSWGNLLQQYGVQRAALWYAKHIYGWFKITSNNNNNNLLNTSQDSGSSFLFPMSLNEPQQQDNDKDEAVALTLLENASGATNDDPLWGPPDDPVANIEASVLWKGNETNNGKNNNNNINNSQLLEPLLT